MLHNQSLLGFSLLVLSCASPTLSAAATVDPPASFDSSSPPSSPVMSTNPEFAFKDTNPPLPLRDTNPPLRGTFVSSSTSIVTSHSHTSVAQIASTWVSSSAASGTVSATTSVPTAVSSHTSSSGFNRGSPHHSSAHRAKVHSSIASRLSTQVKLQVNTRTASMVSSVSTPSSSSMPPATTATSAALQVQPTYDSATDPVSSATTSSSFSGLSSSSLATNYLYPTLDVSTTQSLVLPTSDNRSSRSPSEASQRARRSAILAAFLIFGALGALGGGILCFRCGLLPCCNDKPRRRRGPTVTELTAEEGLRNLEKLSPIAFHEKIGSLTPDKPPIGSQAYDLTRNLHAHTLSCSTCPPDSLNGVKGGISGTGVGSESDWRVYATTPDGEFEDVTHILSSDAFTGKKSSEDVSSSGSRSPRDSAQSGKSGNTFGSAHSGSEPRMSTGTVNSVRTHATNRVSGGAASMTAESYTTCESRYSTPSIERDIRGDGASSARASAFGSISEESESSQEFHSPATMPASPNSSASGGSVSVLLMTPEQPDYSVLADAALPRVTVIDPHGSESEVGSMDMEVEGESDWDVATAYGAPPSHPLPPTPTPITRKGSGRGRPPTGVGLVQGAVAVGGRTCVLMQG